MSFALSKPKELGLSEKEKRAYNLLNALGNMARGNWEKLGLEGEASRAIENRIGRPPQGIYVPLECGWGQRDLTVGTATAGGHLKGTDHLGDEFIDSLREKSVLFELGARRMSGLVGDVAIPALNDKSTAYWVAENSAPTEGAPTVRQITMSPKTVAGYIDLSRKLMIQSSPSAESMFRNDLVNQIALAIDRVGINGGGSNEPTGILQTTGIGSIAIGTNGGAPTWASLVNLVREVSADNADVGALGFLSNPETLAKLRSTVRVASTDSQMLLGDKNELFGHRVIGTNLVPNDLTKGSGSNLSAMIFGNFSDVIIGEWGGVDVLADPFTNSSTGATRVTVFASVDVAVRHAESFSAIQDLITT